MTRIATLTAVALAACALAAAAAPWRVSRSIVVSAFTAGRDRGVEVRASATGRVTFKLLPRPRLQATSLSVSAEGGAVLLDAPLLKADLDIPSLLRGAWRMSSATLVEPTLTVDVDRLARRAEGRANKRAEKPAGKRPGARVGAGPPAPGPRAAASDDPLPAEAASPDGAPLTVRLRSGLLRTRSASGFADLVATAVDASAIWSGDGIVASGTATLRGTAAQFTATLQRPALSLTAAGSPASLQIASPAFDLSADGVVSDGGSPGRDVPGGTASGGPQPQFVGRASLSTPSLPRLLRMLDDAPLPLAPRRAQIGGDVVARPHELSLANAQLRLDRARYEGTLAWRRESGGDGRGLLAGTLATDRLDLAALAGDGPEAAELRDLYGRALTASSLGTDVDLRVSATEARLGRVTLADAAFGALVRGDRLELTLDEAGAYRGLVKARAVLALGPGGIDAHAELSAKQVELGALSEGLSGRGRLDGAVTGHVALDGRGASLRAVVADLAGGGQVGVENLRLGNLSLAQALRRLGRRPAADGGRRGAPTVFDRAQWDLSVRDGVLRIPQGRATAPGVALDFDAETGLSDGRVDLHAVATQTDGAGAAAQASAAQGSAAQGSAAMPFDLRGFWTGPLALVGGQPGPFGGAPVAVPLIDGLGAAR